MAGASGHSGAQDGSIVKHDLRVEEMTMKISILNGGINAACFGAAFVLLAATGVTPAAAQASAPDQMRLNVTGATVPTTKILAIGHWTPKATMAGVTHLLPNEVRDTVRLYLDGVIDQWFIQQDNSGVVFLLNVTDADKAHRLLEKLPLGQAGLMEFQLLPLGPISALGSLIRPPTN
jgi:hypothetical protein